MKQIFACLCGVLVGLAIQQIRIGNWRVGASLLAGAIVAGFACLDLILNRK